jgi:hypothetical protein
MAKMRADISLTTSFNFTLPKIKLFEFEDPQMDAAFRILDQPQIPLSAVINQTLQDDLVYKTESDKLFTTYKHWAFVYDQDFNGQI